ncbi:MAG: flagellar biosynthetic protein FliR [Pseudomonadota bacterium]
MEELLNLLQQQVDFTRAIVAMALVLARLLVIVQLTPFLGGKNAPPEVKMGIAIALNVLIFPIVYGKLDGPIPLDAVNFIFMMLKEVFIGLFIGFIGAELFYAVEMAGQFMNLLNGTNMVQIQVPQLQERSSAFGDLNYQLLLVIFLAFNGHHIFLDVMFQSFVDLPINRWPEFSAGMWPLIDLAMRITGDLFLIAVGVAAPIGIACLITDISFGLLNRVAPQINAYFMAMPAKAMVGAMMFFVALPMILQVYEEHSMNMLGLVRGVLILFR